MALEIGRLASAFCLQDQDDEKLCIEDLKGKWVVLYFYPKDNTSGCSREAQEFSAAQAEFEKLGAVILGCSKDSTKSHRNFIAKMELTIRLLSDPDITVIKDYDAWQKKKNYGREYMGIQRSTVLIDPEGRVAEHWPKVKVAGHADAVLAKLRELAG